MKPVAMGWAGERETTRWLLDLPPGRVLDRVEREAGRDRLSARVQEHGFRLHVRPFWRNDPSPELVARVSRSGSGSELEFRVEFPLAPLLWLLPTLFLAPGLGMVLGGATVAVVQSPESWASILGGLGCLGLPLGLLWFGVLALNSARMKGKSRRLLRFLDDVLGEARILDAEPAGGAKEEAPAPVRRGWRRPVLVGVLAVLAGALVGAGGMVLLERQGRQERALVAGVRHADPKQVARITFTPAQGTPWTEPVVVERPEVVEAVCKELGSGTRYYIGKGEKHDWSYTLTLEWDDGQTSRCEVLTSREGVFLRILEHRGREVSRGAGEFQLADVKLLLDPREAAE